MSLVSLKWLQWIVLTWNKQEILRLRNSKGKTSYLTGRDELVVTVGDWDGRVQKLFPYLGPH